MASLTRADRRPLIGMALFVLLLHLVGWGVLIGLISPKHYQIGPQLYGIGLGVTAYVLGMRHAFDADHIAAIDNTTRKLLADGKRPLTVGFWFSLGHSTVVFAMCLALVAGLRALVGQVQSDSSRLQRVTSVIGPSVSGVFLLLLGLLNLVTLLGVVRIFRRMRTGEFDEAQLEAQLQARGGMNRLLGGLTKAVRKPWHIYPIGILFGLGFDTATEISLLVLASGASLTTLPWYAVLVLPILFAAGMSLLDSIDGVFMNFAYNWAFAQPVRKVFYNLTVTALSVAVALVIGGIELAQVLANRLDVSTGLLGAVRSLSLDGVGYAIAVLFAVTWLLALAYWRIAKVEERWGLSARPTDQ